MSDASRGRAGCAVALLFTAFGSMSVVAWLYTRTILLKSASYEEVAIILAWAFNTAHSALICFEIGKGVGDHVSDMSDGQLARVLLPFWVSVPMYSIAIYLTKVSMLLLYIRLFKVKSFALVCKATIAFMSAFLVWTVFGFLFMCRPVNYFWDKSIDGYCFDARYAYFTSSPFNIITDFLLLGLPVRILWKLHLPRKERIILIVLFAVGLVGCLTSVLRLWSLYTLAVSQDLTYDILDAATWSAVELNVAIICTCIPTLRPLFIACFQRVSSAPAAIRSGGEETYDLETTGFGTKLRSHGAYARFDKETSAKKPEEGTINVVVAVEVSSENEGKVPEA